MLMALLKGKLSHEQENMEDILTSNIFGTLQYFPPSQGLLLFINQAINDETNPNNPFRNIKEVSEVTYEFWPYLNESDCNPCEPDVLIRLTAPQGERFIVLIEAKYLSGKSSERDEGERPNDQLAREYDNLKIVAKKEKRVPILIYLTAGLSIPKDEMEASQSELECKRKIKADFYWLSWRHLIHAIEKSKDPMLLHLVQVMRKMNLLFFSGFTSVNRVIPISWFFARHFDWKIINIPKFVWRFES